jgi:hypothetical protein
MLNAGRNIICPVCYQHAKIYKRSITDNMGACLINLYRLALAANPDDPCSVWVRYTDFWDLAQAHGGDFARFRFYGFIRSQHPDSKEPAKRGAWCITPAGVDFVINGVPAPRWHRMYSNGCLDKSEDELITLHQVLGDLTAEPVKGRRKKKHAFDYNDLMTRPLH